MSLISLVLAVLIVLGLLLINEVWWRRRTVHDEINRKFVHITVGSFVAFWPFFLSWNQIIFLSLAFLVVVGVSKYFNLFQAIHSVQRPTWGEICFALAVGIIAVMTQDKWIYMTALLLMSLADGLAAIIGTTFGKGNRYKFLGHTKSVVGTLTFFAVSILILTSYGDLSDDHLSTLYLLELALGASLIENVGIRGLDNLIVPLFVAGFLASR